MARRRCLLENRGSCKVRAPVTKSGEEIRMPIAIRDTTIVTSDAARTVHHDAAIVIDTDRIVAIGPTEALDRRFPGAERIDGRGKAVFPGLVNCHTHLWFTVARGIQGDFALPFTL